MHVVPLKLNEDTWLTKTKSI